MSLVVVCGGKSAGGVTTSATVLAAVWPTAAVLADCDPSGGDLALRLPTADGGWLARDKGIVGLAAKGRVNSSRVDVAAQTQRVVGGLAVLVGVESPAQAAKVGPAWPLLAQAMSCAPDGDVIADAGRLLPGLPNEHLVRRADQVVLVTRPTVEAIAHLRHTLRLVDELQDRYASAQVVVLTEAKRFRDDTREVEAALAEAPRTVVVHALAFDPPAAAALAGIPTRRLDRSQLVSSARALARELHDALTDDVAHPSVMSAGVGAG